MRTCPNCGDPTDGEYLHADCEAEYEAHLVADAERDAARAAARLQERGQITARRQARAILARPVRRR